MYLGKSGLVIAYKSFVRPVCEYVDVIFMGASALYLRKLDEIQKAAEKLSDNIVTSSQGQCHWYAVQAAGFPLSATTADFLAHPYLYHTSPPSTLLQRSFVKYNSLDLFLNNFLGMVPTVWSTIQPTL